MKKLLLTIGICLCTVGMAVGQVTTTTTIDFETEDDGYSASATTGSGTTDVFNRVNPSIGGNSTFIFAAEDISGDPNISLDQIDVTNATSFSFSLDMLTPNTEDWDTTDEVLITYSVDGGSSQNLMWIQSIPDGDNFNAPAAIDTDFDGDGNSGNELPALTDGASAGVGSNFSNFTTSSISLDGNSTLDITIQFNGLTSGDEGIYMDNIEVDVITPSSSGAEKLAITDVHSGDDPVEGETFSVTVQSQDNSDLPANVSQDTTVTLSVTGGTGTLSGTLTGTITSGNNSVTISGLSYDVAETFTLNATNTGGSLTSDTESVTILAEADQLVIKDFPTTGNKNIAVSSFTVEAQRSSDDSIDDTYTENITISKVSGSGAIGGTVTKAAVDGVATFDDITFDADDTYTIQATDGSITSATSSSLVLDSPDFQETFASYPETGGSYNSGTFAGVAGNTWTYVNARGTPQIDSETVGLQNNGTASLNSTISGGIDSFEFQYQQLFSTDVNLEVYINGDLVSTVTSSSESGVNKSTGTIDVNYIGDFEIEFKQGTGGGQVGIDNFFWNSKEGDSVSITGAQGWRLISSPVTTSFDDVIGDLWTQGFTGSDAPTGASNVYSYDETDTDADADSGYVSISDQSNNFSTATGYAIYVFSDDNGPGTAGDAGFPKALSYSGLIQTDSVTANFTFTSSGSASEDGWNLTGNPFASNIDVDLLAFDDEANLNNFAYVYRNGIFDPLATDGSSSDTIGVGEGFFVKTTAAVSDYKFPIDAATKRYTPNNREVKFKLNKENFISKASIRFHENADFGLEANDAYYLGSLESKHIGFYSTEDGNELSINSLPYDLDMEVSVPFEIAGTETGTFTLEWDTPSNFDAGWSLTLIDNVTSDEIDLMEENTYTFTVDKIVDNRFAVKVTPSTTVSNEPTDKPITFGLEQNYPNPFNPSTTIKYSVGEAGPVSITVYNVMGQKVAELVNTTHNAGDNFQVTWNATGNASGIYYYRLTAPGQTITRQMTLIK